jgi:hypothetical protein
MKNKKQKQKQKKPPQKQITKGKKQDKKIGAAVIKYINIFIRPTHDMKPKINFTLKKCLVDI